MFKILDEACTPTRGTKYSAAVDLRAKEDITIAAGETVLVPLGVKIDLDGLCVEFKDEQFKENYLKSHYLQLMLRSGLGKKGLILPNGVGVIDLDYKDEIMMIVHNPVQLHRFVQNCENRTVLAFDDDIDSEDERSGGFGSTDKKDIYKSVKMLNELGVAEDDNCKL
jgi:dUTP pyrophosphatase